MFNGKLEGGSEFKASSGWLGISKHEICEPQINGEKLLASLQVAKEFILIFNNKITEESYNFVYNVDEIGINWKVHVKHLFQSHESAYSAIK